MADTPIRLARQALTFRSTGIHRKALGAIFMAELAARSAEGVGQEVPLPDPRVAPSKQQVSMRTWGALAILCLGAFVVVLDTTIVNIAIPSIITGLGASLHQVLWVLNAYTLVYAALLITGGRLGDLYGLARVAEEILMAAAEASAEMIAIGFHGVTAELLAISDRPVLVAGYNRLE
jgi:hypothetical protein